MTVEKQGENVSPNVPMLGGVCFLASYTVRRGGRLAALTTAHVWTVPLCFVDIVQGGQRADLLSTKWEVGCDANSTERQQTPNGILWKHVFERRKQRHKLTDRCHIRTFCAI